MFSIAYRAQSQRCIERLNCTIKRMMYAQVDTYKTKFCANRLPMLIENYNTVIHSSTKYAPSLLYSTHNSEKYRKQNQHWNK
jgi:hypothetical protein